jgi:hypothetical protein
MHFNRASWGESRSGGGGLMRLVRRLVVLGFAVIQLVLVGRILLDLGIVPSEGAVAEYLIAWSDALAAPVEGLASGLGGFMGGGGLPGVGPAVGSGLNPVMLAALIGWTVVEGLIMRVVGKFASV